MGRIEDYLIRHHGRDEDDLNSPEIPEDEDINLEEEKEVRDMEEHSGLKKATIDAVEFITVIDTLKFEELTRANVEKILSDCNRHLSQLIRHAPFIDTEGNAVISEKTHRLFAFYRDADNIYGRLWRLHFRVAGFSSKEINNPSTLGSDIRTACYKAFQDNPDPGTRRKITCKVTAIPKAGGDVWEFKHHINLADFDLRGYILSVSTKKKRAAIKEYANQLREAKNKAIASMTWGEILNRKAKRDVAGGMERASQINLFLKKLLS